MSKYQYSNDKFMVQAVMKYFTRYSLQSVFVYILTVSKNERWV
jgi:hypothetical protein